MKKILATAIASLAAIAAGAEPLFPFFVDLVGDYTEVKSGFTHHIGNSNYGGADKAEAFLNDALPDSYGVITDENTFGNRKVRTYTSTMSDGNVSVIYFIWQGDAFSIEYAEGSFTDLLPFYD